MPPGPPGRKGIQVHGAMGYTWEVDLQMFMKRAWALGAAWGDRAFHKSRLADALLADGAAGPDRRPDIELRTNPMAEAFIVDALRSPTGRRKGSLAHVHGADLGAHVIKAIVDRNDIPPAEYDDVMFGCVDTIGALAGDIARTLAGRRVPMNVPGRRSTASAAARSRRCTSPPRR